ncbi:hypothetical protein SCLCIDRAFT_87641, partial [Scleroderma citrinum Foug A]
SLALAAMQLAVTLAGAYLASPPSIANSHPALRDIQYSGRVGELSDVFVFTVPSIDDASTKQEVVRALKGLDGVLRVDELVPRRRSKRDEF